MVKMSSEYCDARPGSKTIPYRKHSAGEGGWSEWVNPNPSQPYKMECCDCGLVHDLEFTAVEPLAVKRNGWFSSRPLDTPFRVLFRARRNKRATDNRRSLIGNAWRAWLAAAILQRCLTDEQAIRLVLQHPKVKAWMTSCSLAGIQQGQHHGS